MYHQLGSAAVSSASGPDSSSERGRRRQSVALEKHGIAVTRLAPGSAVCRKMALLIRNVTTQGKSEECYSHDKNADVALAVLRRRSCENGPKKKKKNAPAVVLL